MRISCPLVSAACIWALASGAARAQQPAALPAAPQPGVQAVWGFGALGSGVGLSGIVVAQNKGAAEIYVGGSGATFGPNTAWHALRYSAATGTYEPAFVSEHLPQGIRRIALMRRSDLPYPLIVVALTDGTIHLHHQPSKYRIATFDDPCAGFGGLQALTTADLDDDESDEFISICGDRRLFAYGFDYAWWMVEGAGGSFDSDVVVGQMDDDDAVEIATTSGQVLDAETREVQWSWPEQFGVHLQAADIDADGRDELVAGDYDGVRTYDVERQLPKWFLPSFDVDAILVADIDGDGIQELLVGDGQWGDVRAFSTLTQQEEWSIPNPEHGVANVAVGDVNNDGTPELLWGAGYSSTGSDHLYVADWSNRTILWQNEHLDGPFLGPAIGDLDGDAVPEIVVASSTSESGYESGRIVVLDSRTLAVRAISGGVAGGSYGWTGIHDLKLRDLDGDGRLEILVATDWLYDGAIEAYRFSTDNVFTQVWTNATRPYGAPFHSVDVADVDGDGSVEVVGGVGREHTGAVGTYVYVYDVATSQEEWKGAFPLTWDAVSELAIADLDGDGGLEIAGMIEGGDVYVFDGATRQHDAVIQADATSLSIVPRAAGPPLLALGSGSGAASIRAFDGIGYPEVAAPVLASSEIDGLHVTGGAVWLGTDGTLRRFQGGTVWRSAGYGAEFGRRLAMLSGTLVFSAGAHGVHAFVAVR